MVIHIIVTFFENAGTNGNLDDMNVHYCAVFI